jgi:hypothetical protein
MENGMSNQLDRAEFVHFFMKYAPLSLEAEYGSLQKAALRLMRYATTHVRLETELTNGYKDHAGNWDQPRTNHAIAKRNRIDRKMEAIAPIVYGALTVAVRMNDREYYIPVSRS